MPFRHGPKTGLHPDQCPACMTRLYPIHRTCDCGYRGGQGPHQKMRLESSVFMTILGGLFVAACLVGLGLLF